MIICHGATLHYNMSFKTIAGRSDGVFWWFPALSEDQEKNLLNSPKLSCGFKAELPITVFSSSDKQHLLMIASNLIIKSCYDHNYKPVYFPLIYWHLFLKSPHGMVMKSCQWLNIKAVYFWNCYGYRTICKNLITFQNTMCLFHRVMMQCYSKHFLFSWTYQYHCWDGTTLLRWSLYLYPWGGVFVWGVGRIPPPSPEGLLWLRTGLMWPVWASLDRRWLPHFSMPEMK